MVSDKISVQFFQLTAWDFSLEYSKNFKSIRAAHSAFVMHPLKSDVAGKFIEQASDIIFASRTAFLKY